MVKNFRRPLSIAFGAFVTTALGGCYYGDVYGSSHASAGSVCADRYYDYDPYAYDDGYGYNCYDGSDYGSGFVQIGFGGGWYDDYYYPGYGMWMFDHYRNRYPLRDQYLNYWGGRRAWWKHHRDRPGRGHWNRPGRGDGDGRPDRPGRPGWNRGDRDGDGPRGTRPPRPGNGAGTPPTTTNPVYPGRPGRGDGTRPNWPGRGDGNGARPGRPGGGRPDGARPPRPAPPPAARPAPAPRPAPALPRGRDDRADHTKPQ